MGVLYAFISYLGRLNEPLIELTTQQSMLQQAVVAGASFPGDGQAASGVGRG